MRSMRSVQRQVGLRRLGNQIPVLGKANSLCKSVNKCVFCLRLSQRRVRDRIPGYRSSGKIRVASRRCNTVPLAPPSGEKMY